MKYLFLPSLGGDLHGPRAVVQRVVDEGKGELHLVLVAADVVLLDHHVHCIVVVEVHEPELLLGPVLVGDPEGARDEAELREVGLQLGVVYAVLQPAHVHSLGLVTELYPRSRQVNFYSFTLKNQSLRRSKNIRIKCVTFM